MFVLPAQASAQQTGDTPKPIWLAVTTEYLKPAVEPLASFRRAEGFETVISTRLVPDAIKSINRKPAFILIVGDDQDGKDKEPWYVAAKRLEFHRWDSSQRETFASDAAWGDIDGDLMPDVPVGRIPARTIEEARLVVAKILAYEKRPPDLSTLRMPVWAGAAEFGPIIDRITTGILLNSFQLFGPKWIQPWAISSDPNHPWCGWPDDQAADFTKQLKAGGVFSALIGHGSQEYFYSMRVGDKTITYKASDAQELLGEGEPAPPLAMICCLCGDFTTADNCLAESMLMLKGGPAATIAASAESHPVTNFYVGRKMLAKLRGPNKRLGDFWLEAQRAALQTYNPLIESLTMRVQNAQGQSADMEGIRSDHILIYNIFGDPATNLKLPGELKATVTANGDKWEWKVKKPDGATSVLAGIRPEDIKCPPGNPDATKEDARRLREKANAQFEFASLPAVEDEDGWHGTVNSPGLLRIVAVTPEKLYVATVTLARPDAKK